MGRGEVAASAAKDARFKDPAWSENQYFDFMKQAYLIILNGPSTWSTMRRT